MAKLTREERDYYHVSLDAFRTNLAVMDHERNEGRAEGHAEGLAEGVESERVRSINSMRAKGMDGETIADVLGLDIIYVKTH